MRMGRSGAPLLALCLAAFPASGEEQLPVRFEAAARAGMAFPIGNATGNASLADLVAWTVPLQLDAGARIGPVFVGGYVSYAFGKTGSLFDGASDRSASDVRFGFQVLWHFAPDTRVDPWAGLGVGYEWLNLSITGNNGTVYANARGFEWVNVQTGLDFMLGRSFRLGPYVEAHVAQYDTGTLGVLNNQGGQANLSGDIQNKQVHAWIGVGLRFAFLL